jgi:hypothetical protein
MVEVDVEQVVADGRALMFELRAVGQASMPVLWGRFDEQAIRAALWVAYQLGAAFAEDDG